MIADHEKRENALAEKSMAFAVTVVKLTKQLAGQREYVISRQLSKSATSIGANLREAQFAHSRADFISKLQIALKEANETDYWLELLFRSEYIDSQSYQQLRSACKEIGAMLISSINTAKKNAEQESKKK